MHLRDGTIAASLGQRDRAMIDKLTVVDHPLVRDKLGRLRDKATPMAEFRRLLREIALLLGCEATRGLALDEREIETPLARTRVEGLAPDSLVFVSILRAGNGLLRGMLDLYPEARVGLIGLQRDPETLEPSEYSFAVPPGLADSTVIVVDPMLATGHTAIAAVTRLKGAGARDLRFVSVVAAPEGLDAFGAAHGDVPLITAAVDEGLDAEGHIVPGIGDAGDRLHGTL
jgi:uracil phosphoribosyltransferase